MRSIWCGLGLSRVHPGMRIHLTLCGCSVVIYGPMEVK